MSSALRTVSLLLSFALLAPAASAAKPSSSSSSSSSSSKAPKTTAPAKGTKKKPPPAPAPAPVVEAPPPTPVVEAPPPPPPPPAKAAVRRLAVYELDAGGVDKRVVRVLTDSVVAEVRKLDHVAVVGMDEIKAMLDLEAQKQVLGCSDESCLAEIAEALGVDGIIIGSVAIVGETTTFGLKHIDQASATTLGQANRRIEGTDPENVLAAVGPVVQELFPDAPLKAGLTRGVPEEMALRIHPPPLSPVVFWSLLGGAGAAAVVGGGFGAFNLYTANVGRSALTDTVGTDSKVAGDTFNQQQGVVRLTFIGAVAGGAAALALAGGAGAAALFTDWDNLRGAE